MKMTRAEYLKARGWSQNDPDGLWYPDSLIGSGDELNLAVNRQLARDADEERQLHRAVIAARMSIGHAARDGGMVRAFGAFAADDEAAEAVERYRLRFAVEFTD